MLPPGKLLLPLASLPLPSPCWLPAAWIKLLLVCTKLPPAG
jgi:hypothetical protein